MDSSVFSPTHLVGIMALCAGAVLVIVLIVRRVKSRKNASADDLV